MSYPESPWSYTDFSFLAAIALGMGAIICVVSLAKEFVLVALALLVVVCFLLGSIPWGVIISKSVFHTDIREHGSGNIGTTNAMRTMGKKGGVAVFVLDFGKGLLSGLIALFVLATFIPGAGVAADSPVSASTVVALAFLCCTLGHIFSPWLKFKGGKGILSGGTVAIMIDWRVALVVWGGFLILTVMTRYVSLGSLWAGASFPFISWYCYPQTPIIVLAFCLGGLIVWKHRANIQRLLAGNENKLSFHRKKT